MTVDKDPFDRANRLQVSHDIPAAERLAASPLESAISVEFNTGSLPVAQANAAEFIELMAKRLKAAPSEELSMFVMKSGIELKSVSLKQLDSMLPISVKFRDGSIQYDQKAKRTYVQLSFITLSAVGGAMKVGAYGTTDDAEKGLSIVCECLFEAAGMARQWTDVKGSIVAKGYATSSVEKLDAGVEELLSPRLSDFISQKIAGRTAFAAGVGVLPLDPLTGEPYNRDHLAIVKLGALDISVIRLDLKSGDRYETSVRIAPRMTVDAGEGSYVVTSELDHRMHQDLVRSIQSALKRPDKH